VRTGDHARSITVGKRAGHKEQSKVTAAVIGLGMGRGHLNSLLANPDAKVVAACDKAPERITRVRQDHPELKADLFFDDYQKMIDKTRPQAVIVALPNVLHHPVTMAALKAGAHVLCEKPMAMTVAEATEMAATARTLKKILMINFSYRFKATTLAMEKVIAAGQVGQIYFARTGWLRQNGIPRGMGWFYRKDMAGGGPLIDLGVHRIDLAWYLMGRPKVESVSGMTFQKFGPSQLADYDVEDLAAGLVKFKDGRCMQITVSWASFCETPEQMWTELYGTDGALIERNTGGGYQWTVRILKDVAGYRIAGEPAGLPGKTPGSIDHFVDCILNGTEPGPSADDGLEVQRILDGLYQSAATGREVRFEG
jgi:predicted dehydrogenase